MGRAGRAVAAPIVICRKRQVAKHLYYQYILATGEMARQSGGRKDAVVRHDEMRRAYRGF